MQAHLGNSCPVSPDAWVEFFLTGGEGVRYVEQARHVSWGPGVGPDGEGRVQGYRVVSTAPRH